MTCTDAFEQAAKVMLSIDEDERQFPYDDTNGERVRLATGGNITIGIGRNLDAKGLRSDEIALCFHNDLEEALAAAREIFADFAEYETNRQLGIVNLIFNMGEGDEDDGFREFTNTIAAIKRRDWQRAGENLKISKWYRQVKKRGPRVVALIQENRNEYR